MPKKPKISTGERRKWLELSENGDAIIGIAEESGRDVRSVRAHIEKARLERNFEYAQRDHLRDALQGHQKDMLRLLRDLKGSINVPVLDDYGPLGLDFGLEDIWSPSYLARNRESPLPHQPIVIDGLDDARSTPVYRVIRNVNGPQEIELVPEVARLWRALKEHIRQDPLWRHEATWLRSCLDELNRRAELNRAIRENAEKIFGLKVGLRGGPEEPWLAPAAITWVRTLLTNDAPVNDVRTFDEDLDETSPGSLRSFLSGQELTMGIEEAKDKLQRTFTAMEGSREVTAAVESYQRLKEMTKSIHDAIDEYLLIHYITGGCRLCQKLGGQ